MGKSPRLVACLTAALCVVMLSSSAGVADPADISLIDGLTSDVDEASKTCKDVPTTPGDNGDSSDEEMHGDSGPDVMNGHRGADTISSHEGADVVCGGRGADTIYGGQDGDSLFGQHGDDQLWGQAGSDYLDGGSGHDNCHVQSNDFYSVTCEVVIFDG